VVVVSCDPGIKRCGIVVLDGERILAAMVVPPSEVRERLQGLVDMIDRWGCVPVIERLSDDYVAPERVPGVVALARLEGKLEDWFPGAKWVTRNAVLQHIGAPVDTKRGGKDRAAKWRVRELFGQDVDRRGLKCPKRNNKNHPYKRLGPRYTGVPGKHATINCPSCNGIGWQREPGPLAGLGADGIDALALAVAYRDGVATVEVGGE